MTRQVYTLGQLLDQHRLTQRELAEMLGCSPARISAWLDGRRISPSSYAAICKLFDLEHGQLQLQIGAQRKLIGSAGGGGHSHERAGKLRGLERSEITRARMRRGQLLRWSKVA